MLSPTDIPFERYLVASGSWAVIEYGVRRNGSRPAKEFIDGLEKADRARLFALFQLATSQKIHNEKQFKHERGKIYCFKRRHIRISCFQIQSRWVLLHGFVKKGQKWGSELDRAEKLMEEHLEMER